MQSKISRSINYDEQFYVTIEGYDNYKVNPDGQVLNVKKNKLLKPYMKNNGYYAIDLYKQGKRKMKYIHQLVAEAFLIKPSENDVVDHINQDKTLNSIENLRYVSIGENNRNISSHGKIKYNFVDELPNDSLWLTHVKGIDVSDLCLFYNKTMDEFYMKTSNTYRVMTKKKIGKQYKIGFGYNKKVIHYSTKQLKNEYPNYFEEE